MGGDAYARQVFYAVRFGRGIDGVGGFADSGVVALPGVAGAFGRSHGGRGVFFVAALRELPVERVWKFPADA